MSDGIIQKVFKAHLHIQDANEKNCNRCNLLNLIQQELIEKIKKDYPWCVAIECINLRYLIGDNIE